MSTTPKRVLVASKQSRLLKLSATVEQNAVASVMLGALALERGDATQAERYLRQALAFPRDAASVPHADGGVQPIAESFLRLLDQGVVRKQAPS